MKNKDLHIEDFQEYFVLDEKTGDLFIRTDFLKIKLSLDKFWLLLKIMFFNSEKESDIEEHLNDIKFFEQGESEYLRIRREYNASRDMLFQALVERDGCLCQHCHSVENLTVDHIIPVSRGGKNYLSNLQILCKSCNSKKGAKIISWEKNNG